MDRLMLGVSRWTESHLTQRLLPYFVWTGVALLAIVHLPMPLTGDQALYMYGAKTLAGGQALYLDFWDAKQPGVYLFYLTAGTLFSFSEFGLHLLEALWFGAAAWFAYRIGRNVFPTGLVMLVIPWFTAGTYFIAVDAWHMSQPDGLATTPLVAAAWALCDRQLLRRRLLRLFLFGVAAGTAAMFKVTLILVPLVMVATCWLFSWRAGQRHAPGQLLAELGAWLAGLAIPVGGVALWFAAHDALAALIWTTFHYPLDTFEEISRYPEQHRIQIAVEWFVRKTFHWIPFALVGAVWSFRRFLGGDRAGFPGTIMAVWLLAGACTLLLQNHFSWAFHFNQFFAPLGVLAAIGIAAIFRDFSQKIASKWTRFALALLAAAVLVFGAGITGKLTILVQALGGADDVRTAYESRFSPASQKISASLQAALPSGDEDASVYIFGDPRILLASNRRQAIPHNGWALEIMTAGQWADFAAALMAAKPDYVYVSRRYLNDLPLKAPDLLGWLDEQYHSFHTDTMDGHWYQHR